MSIHHKAIKYRLYPNAEQKVLLAKTFGCVRMVYNHYLSKRIEVYRQKNSTFGYAKCTSDLVGFKQENNFLKEVDSKALIQSLRHLDAAFQNFFRNKGFGFPTYKSKHTAKKSYTTYQNVYVKNGYVRLPKLGKVKAKIHRTAPRDWIIKSATVSLHTSGRYYVSLTYEYEQDIIPIAVNKDNVIGLDYSTPHLFVDSNGFTPTEMFKYYKLSAEKLAKEQRKLSKKSLHSKNWNKQHKKLSQVHCKIANQRNDALHKVSAAIAKQYDAVVIEDISIKEQLQGRKYKNFRKSTLDNGWHNFTRMLDYKLRDRGKQLIQVDKDFPSTKTCHCCGNVNTAITDDAVRRWECPVCGEKLSRDTNAAINIKNEGLKILGVA